MENYILYPVWWNISTCFTRIAPPSTRGFAKSQFFVSSNRTHIARGPIFHDQKERGAEKKMFQG